MSGQSVAKQEALMPRESGARIEIRSLTKRFYRGASGDEVIPVNDVNLTLSPREILVLLGPSGCGKTTLLRCVAGLERPDAGEIIIDGRVVFSSAKGIFVPPNKRNVGMMFQSYALWPHLSVLRNVTYPLRVRKVSSADAERRGREVLATVGLDTLADQYPGQISGGQQQRVALARSIVAGQDVILFDEPLSNVDAKVRQQLRVEILRLQRSLGFSALYVTHDQAEAMELSNRIAVLDGGVIAQLDTPTAIYRRPQSRYIANFVGIANIWDAVVTSRTSETCTVATSQGNLHVDTYDQIASPAVGDRVSIMFRPEDARFGAVDDRVNTIKCKIDTRLFAGSHTEYVLLVEGGATARVWTTESDAHPESASSTLHIPPSRIRLLPGESNR